MAELTRKVSPRGIASDVLDTLAEYDGSDVDWAVAARAIKLPWCGLVNVNEDLTLEFHAHPEAYRDNLSQCFGEQDDSDWISITMDLKTAIEISDPADQRKVAIALGKLAGDILERLNG